MFGVSQYRFEIIQVIMLTAFDFSLPAGKAALTTTSDIDHRGCDEFILGFRDNLVLKKKYTVNTKQ